MDIRFWSADTTRCLAGRWNSDVPHEPWSKLYMILEGRARYAVARPGEDPHWCDLRRGRLYLVPGGRRQINACSSDFTLVWSHFTVQDLELAGRLAAVDQVTAFPAALVPDASVIARSCDAALSCRLRAAALVLELLARLPDPPVDVHDADRRRLAPAVSQIEYRFAQALSVARLAQLAGLRQSRFQQIFRQIHGASVREYQLSLRLAEAKRLLSTTTLDIQGVAERCGYGNPFNFTRFFTRRCGISPSRWRAEARVG